MHKFTIGSFFNKNMEMFVILKDRSDKYYFTGDETSWQIYDLHITEDSIFGSRGGDEFIFTDEEEFEIKRLL